MKAVGEADVMHAAFGWVAAGIVSAASWYAVSIARGAWQGPGMLGIGIFLAAVGVALALLRHDVARIGARIEARTHGGNKQ